MFAKILEMLAPSLNMSYMWDGTLDVQEKQNVG